MWKFRGVLCLVIAAAPFACASAQTAPYQEYDKLVKAAEMVEPLKSDLFGDNVSLYNGATEFSVVDIQIPGNDALPVSLGRTFKVELRNDADSLGGFGAWDLEVPYIYGVFPDDGKWNVSGNTALGRCSQPFFPDVSAPFGLSDVWTGTKVHVPGRGDQTMMWNGNSGNPQPTDGQGYYWNTRDLMRFSCTSMLNYPGQGFVGVDSAGTRYVFNYAIERAGGVIRKAAAGWGEVARNRTKIYLVATRVEDRHGNSVNYTYQGDRLVRIASSDGRAIDLVWNDGRIIKAVTGSREWHYAYSPNQYFSIHQRAKVLTSVTLPDQSRWNYQYQGGLSMEAAIQDGSTGDARCLEPLPSHASFALVATHPSGATGNFTFEYLRHGVSGTPANACVLEAVINGVQHWNLVIPDYHYAYSLSLKQITGPGLAPMRWDYLYGDPLTGRANYSGLYCTICDDAKSVWVKNPDGTKDEYVFGALFNFNDGRLLAKYRRRTDNTVASAELTEYVGEAEVASMPFPKEFGYLHGSFDYTAGYNRPVKKVTILQDGDIAGPVEFVPPPPPTPDPPLPPDPEDPPPPVCVPQPPIYTCDQPTSLPGGPIALMANAMSSSPAAPVSSFIRQVNAFDEFARPVDETRQGPVHARRTTTSYHDNKSRWILGQVASVACLQSVPASGICNGDDVMSSTLFDGPTALPTAHYSFGKLRQSLSYHPDGTVATFRDGNNNLTSLSSWKRGIPQTIQHPATPESPAGAIESAAVNDSGWITSVTNEVGAKTCYTHDSLGRITLVTHPSEAQANVCDTSTWLATGIEFRPMTTADWRPPGVAAGQWRHYTYRGNYRKMVYLDAMWRPVLTHEYDATDTPGTLRASSSEYDENGRVKFQSYPSSDLVPAPVGAWSFYDALGRVTKTQQNSEHGLLTTLTEYLPGFQTRVTNPRGYQTQTIYQAFDQPTYDSPAGVSELGGDRHTEIYRDPFGKVTALRRRNGDASTQLWRYFVYDAHQQLCKVVEPETGATVMDYDGAGNLQWSASGLHNLMGTANCDTIAGRDSGRKVTRYYDNRNRLQQLLFPDGAGDQLWTYTPDGLPASITANNSAATVYNGTQVVNSYTYNKRRLLTGESSAQPGWYSWGLGYGYDASASLSTQTYPTGLVISYAPNALGQATQARDQSGYHYASGASYFPNGAVKQFSYGNGIVHAMAQNARQLPASVVDGGVSDLRSHFDANGNVTDIYDVARGAHYNRHMQYDGLDRLTAAGSWVFGGDAWHRFSYDALDNMKSWTLAGVKDHAQYVYDAQNRLGNIKNSSGATIVGFGYDAQGNLQNKNGQEYVFDFGNRLRVAQSKEHYRYDAHGRRVLAWDAASTASILSQYGNSGQLMYEENYRPNALKAVEHIFFAGSLVASRERDMVLNTYVVKYQHTDALGSPVAVTDAAGSVIERNDYEPYGAVVGKPNYQGIGYTGHVQDSATGLTYMQQRYYDPQVGSFLSVDPVAAYSSPLTQFHRYVYANNNPYVFIDPDGRRDVYIGGGFDKDASRIVQDFASSQQQLHPDRDIQYFAWHEGEKIRAALIAPLSENEPLNVVGHSLGAREALAQANDTSAEIANLVTIDPVGATGDGSKPSNVEVWTNVTASADTLSAGEVVAYVGRRLEGTTNVSGADATHTSSANHGSFPKMMSESKVLQKIESSYEKR